MKLPFVISTPHSSANVPGEVRVAFALSPQQVVESVDFGTEEIFDSLPAQEKVAAKWSRLVVDLNRDPVRTDAKGVTALTDYHGRAIYRSGMAPDQQTIVQRIKKFHRPYHKDLERALGNSKVIGLIDGHSLNGIGPSDAPDSGQIRKDVTLSNNGNSEGFERPGAGPITCSTDKIQLFKHCFEAQGFSVSLNAPYKGGYIVNRYGPLLAEDGRFAIQIEMNQDLYMTSGSLKPEAHSIQTVRLQVMTALEQITTVLLKGGVP